MPCKETYVGHDINAGRTIIPPKKSADSQHLDKNLSVGPMTVTRFNQQTVILVYNEKADWSSNQKNKTSSNSARYKSRHKHTCCGT